MGDYFSASGAASSSRELQETLSRLDVKVHGYQIGGPPGLAVSITPSNIGNKYSQFVQDTNENNWAAVDISTNNYQRPIIYSDYRHEDIFAKYTGKQGPLAQFERWTDISVQWRERCDPWAEYGQSSPSQCHTAQVEISIAMDTCRETREWEKCVHPHQYSTGNLTTTYPGTDLYGWLSGNVKKLHPENISKYHKPHVHKGTKQVNDETCLPSDACFANIYRGTGSGIGKGFSVTEHYYDNPKGEGNRRHKISPKHCVKSTAHLKTYKWGGDTTADWQYTVDFEGLCPQNKDFVIIP